MRAFGSGSPPIPKYGPQHRGGDVAHASIVSGNADNHSSVLVVVGLAAALDVRSAGEVAVDASDALDLALGREPLVEAVDPELLDQIGPRREPLGPALDAVVLGVGVLGGEVGADPEQGLERDRAGDHEAGVAPGVAPGSLAGAQEVAHDLVVALGLALGVRFLLDLLPVGGGPAMDLVEQLGLEDPFLLLAAAA